MAHAAAQLYNCEELTVCVLSDDHLRSAQLKLGDSGFLASKTRFVAIETSVLAS